MSKYFSIPHDDLISAPPPTVLNPTGDYHFAHSELLFWGQADQGSRQVVVLAFRDPEGQGTKDYIALDGPWRQQLESCVGGCDGGDGPVIAGTQRVAYGGIYQPEPTGYDEVRFTAPGEWVTLTSDVVDLVGYAGDATDEVTYDLDENSMTLDWVSPIPTGRQFAQFTIFWSVAAVGNDQTYEFGVLSNGTDVTAPSGRAVLSYERAGDVETLAQQGQALVENGDKVQLIVRNVNGTNPLRLFTVNARMTVSAQSDPV